MNGPRISATATAEAEDLQDMIRSYIRCTGMPCPELETLAQRHVTRLSYLDEDIGHAVTTLRRGLNAPLLVRRIGERQRVTDLALERAKRRPIAGAG